MYTQFIVAVNISVSKAFDILLGFRQLGQLALRVLRQHDDFRGLLC